MSWTVTGPFGPGRRLCVLIDKPGNLPVVGTGMLFPNHEELIVPVYGVYAADF